MDQTVDLVVFILPLICTSVVWKSENDIIKNNSKLKKIKIIHSFWSENIHITV